MLHFPLNDVLDEHACYDFLLHVLHPDGLHCPHGHPLPADQAAHARHRAPILDDRCRTCGAVFNLFTGTIWTKTHYRCSTIVQILRGLAQGVPTKHLAMELGIDRGQLLERRHRIQAVVAQQRSPLRAPSRCSHGGRRTVPERGRARPPTPRPERSAPVPRE